MLEKATVYYVTAIPVPRNAPASFFAEYEDHPERYQRADMAKFYSEEDARDHMASIGGSSFYDRRVEPREEMVDSTHLVELKVHADARALDHRDLTPEAIAAAVLRETPPAAEVEGPLDPAGGEPVGHETDDVAGAHEVAKP